MGIDWQNAGGLTKLVNNKVILYYAEPSGMKSSFNVAINGSTVLSGFDISKAAGYNTAIDKTFTVTGSTIAITETPKGGNQALINGIEITQ